MVSGLASPPPGLGLGNFGGLQLPKPPPGLGSNAIKNIGGGLKTASSGAVRIGSGALGAVALDLLFPKSTAKSSLSDVADLLGNAGTESEIEKPRTGYEPKLYGNAGFSYSIDVYYTRVDENLGVIEQDRRRGSYVSYDSYGLTYERQSNQSKFLILHRKSSSREPYTSNVTTASKTQELVGIRIEVFTQDPDTQPPNNQIQNPSQLEPGPGIKSVAGISGDSGSWIAPPPSWGGGYTGPSSVSNPIGSPISPPPTVGGGQMNPTTVSGPSNTGDNTASGVGGVAGGSSSTSSGTGAVAGGSSGAGGSGGIVGGGVIGGGTTTTGDSTITGGGTATGTGTGTGEGSGDGSGELIGGGTTGTETGTDEIPILDGDGTQTDTTDAGTTDDLKPGVRDIPNEGIVSGDIPGEITKPGVQTNETTNTPSPPPEEGTEKEEIKIIPVPWNLNPDPCCEEIKRLINELADDLECVIQKICFPEDDLLREYVRVQVIKDPSPRYVFNNSTGGNGDDTVICGYLRWVVDGLIAGDELPIRRRDQLFLIPEWADGYNLYSTEGSILTASIIFSSNDTQQ